MFTPVLLLLLTSLLMAMCISLCVAWWLLWPLRKAIAAIMPVFGATPSDRIIALGLTSLICHTSIFSLVSVPFSAVCDLISVSVASFAETVNAVDLRDSSQSTEFWNLFASAAQRESRTISYQFSNTIKNLSRSLPFADIFIALGVWSLVGQGISTTDTGTSQGKRLLAWVRNWNANTRANVALSFLFVSGSYMCVAAIVAIPWLAQYGETDIAEQSVLRSRLDQILGADSKFNENFPQDYASKFDPAKALRTQMDDIQVTNLQQAPLPPERRDQLKNILLELDGQRETLQRRWKFQIDEAMRRRRVLMAQCLDAFTTNTRKNMTPRERDVYAYDLTKWFTGRIDSIDQLMIFAKQEVDRSSENWRFWSEDVLHDLRTNRELRRVDAVSDRSGLTDMLRGYASQNQDTPPYPASDLDLGPFGFFAGWLVRTRSLPLALITGMIGFGIIGAGVSTFVQQSIGKSQEAPDSRVIIGVFIRGLSAAIVVFLGVEGGLAVFATGKNEPNAYVLFFTCLVGAVYSERVWLWAEGRLTEVLRGGNGTEIEGVPEETGLASEKTEDPQSSDLVGETNQIKSE